jgi:hypothetical protein
MERKCPLCGGEMVKSGTNQAGYSRYFWRAPWEKGLAKLGKGIDAYPWLCIKCGAVIPYLEESVLEKLRTEYERLRASGFRF